ncbi:hypothetical protein CMUS01_12730 [Colletotrichum musicola]|uniref:Uncharacterized protein n=1 Tax=Colletotrichum musicola TaxID=2175873 RepID=A0A8H6JJW3_9PEZI|nr:hypothetical protein CMUS01_12730 [Colletotrichum musicola]
MYADVLETTWSTGRNRYVKASYVRELKDAFIKGGLERGAPENRIAVLCSAKEASINDTKAEVMVGQHQLRALQEYVKAIGAPVLDAWWTYRLPADLNIKLRINRRDLRLPNNYGQIWTQLVSIALDAVEPSAHDRASTINHKLVEALRLGGEKSFPTRRLITL